VRSVTWPPREAFADPAQCTDDVCMMRSIELSLGAGLLLFASVATAQTAHPEAYTAPAGAADAADDGSCPASVKGARTAIKDTDKGVQITVTAKDARSAREVQRRARQIASVRKVPTSTSGPPRPACVVGFYPAAEADLEATPKGIMVTVSAIKEEDAGEVQEAAHLRAEGKLPPPPVKADGKPEPAAAPASSQPGTSASPATPAPEGTTPPR
jgi:hypothetical protein